MVVVLSAKGPELELEFADHDRITNLAVGEAQPFAGLVDDIALE